MMRSFLLLAALVVAPGHALSIAFLGVFNSNDWPFRRTWETYVAGCTNATIESNPKVKIARFSPRMVQAMEELLMRTNATYYHFFSDSCVPVRPCSDLEHLLARQAPKSFVKLKDGKSSQWITLHHSAKPYVMNINELFYGERSRECAGRGKFEGHELRYVRRQCHYANSTLARLSRQCPGCMQRGNVPPEEVVFPDVFLTNNLPNLGRTLTYVEWNNTRGSHPRRFLLTAAKLRAIRQLDPPLFFGRKFFKPPGRPPVKSLLA
jgi:hypothetical protein